MVGVMNCAICKKYNGDYPIETIAKLNGVTLSHIAPSDDGWAIKGRLIIDPIRHVVRIEELTPAEFADMGILLQKAMLLLQNQLGAEHAYFFRINDLVPHFHFHVVPRFPNTPKEFWGLKLIEWPNIPKLDMAGVQQLSMDLNQVVGAF